MRKLRHKMPTAAHLLLRNTNNQILFLLRANTGYADGQWSVPAGHVDPGETFVEACAREALEEIGVQLAPNALLPLLVQQKRDMDKEERVDIFFHAPLPSGASPKILEPERCDELRWSDPFDPPSPLCAYVAAALEVIRLHPEQRISYFGFD